MGSHQEYVPHHPKPEVVYDLPLNLEGLESAFAHCVEFASREIVLVQGGTCTVCWLEGMVKSERLNDYVLRPLITGPVPAEVQKVGDLLQGVIWNLNVQTQTTVDETVAAMVDGSCAVVLPDGVLTCSVPTEEKRSVEGPENETEAKGARDSFVECAYQHLPGAPSAQERQGQVRGVPGGTDVSDGGGCAVGGGHHQPDPSG